MLSHLTLAAGVDFIKSLLSKDATTRLSSWSSVMAHPWFEGFNFTTLLNRTMKSPLADAAVVRQVDEMKRPSANAVDDGEFTGNDPFQDF